MPLITRQLLFPYSGQQIGSSVSKIEKRSGHGSVNSIPPHSPRQLSGICNLKAVLQMPRGGARGRLEILDLRDMSKFKMEVIIVHNTEMDLINTCDHCHGFWKRWTSGK